MRTIALMLASLALLHAFVYALDFRGQAEHSRERARLPALVSLTLPGYALVLLASLLVLWLFGRLDGLAPAQALHMTAVLGLPGALGALVLELASGEVEEAALVLDFLAPRGSVEAAFLFDQDPNGAELRLSAVGYLVPRDGVSSRPKASSAWPVSSSTGREKRTPRASPITTSAVVRTTHPGSR